MDPPVALFQRRCVVFAGYRGVYCVLVFTGIMITNRAFNRSSISGFAVCLPSRSARLFSYHYMIRLVMDLACFYLHIAKGNLLQAFMMARHIRLHHGIVNRYLPLTYTNVNVDYKFFEGMKLCSSTDHTLEPQAMHGNDLKQFETVRLQVPLWCTSLYS